MDRNSGFHFSWGSLISTKEEERERCKGVPYQRLKEKISASMELSHSFAYVAALASDIDSRTSCPTTRTRPMPVEVTTVAKQQMPVELIITAPQLAVIPRSCADTIPKTLHPSAELVVFATFLNLWALGKVTSVPESCVRLMKDIGKSLQDAKLTDIIVNNC
ncbi:hypothetical protein Tco_0778630 [Tanacetum coccineum]